jgi:CRISP-associated protein Cas1
MPGSRALAQNDEFAEGALKNDHACITNDQIYIQMQIVLNTHGVMLKVKNGIFVVTDGVETRMVSPEKITSIAITNPCTLTSVAIELAADCAIPIYLFDGTGDMKAVLRSPYFDSLATLRRNQVYFSDAQASAEWVIELFRLKTNHQVEALQYLANQRPTHRRQLDTSAAHVAAETEKLAAYARVPDAKWSNSLMGWEGSQARKYWQAVGAAMPEGWQFAKRSRRPALDSYNAVTNYAYGMLYSKVEQALFAAGLDPHLGILHADEYDRPTLSYDLIEPFRPWVDRLLMEKILIGELLPEHTEPAESGTGCYNPSDGSSDNSRAKAIFFRWLLI